MHNLVRRDGSGFAPISAFDFHREDFFRPFEQVFDEILNQFTGRDLKSLRSTAGYPKLDAISLDDEFIVEVAIPGVNPADVQVEIQHTKIGNDDRELLHISGHMEGYSEDANYHVRELSRRSFRRSMCLPRNLLGDPDAVFRNGLLTLKWKTSAPAPPKPESKVVQIKVA